MDCWPKTNCTPAESWIHQPNNFSEPAFEISHRFVKVTLFYSFRTKSLSKISLTYHQVAPVNYQDHPRMCGEHWNEYVDSTWMIGSPPHVRGTPCYKPSNDPAPWDHPRMCGEHSGHWVHAITCTGSPPHVRGTPCNTIRGAPIRRITPACAGNTVERDYYLSVCQDHPRMCGEHLP